MLDKLQFLFFKFSRTKKHNDFNVNKQYDRFVVNRVLFSNKRN